MFEVLAPKMEGVVQQILERKNSQFTYKTVIGLPGVGEFTGWQACLDLGYWNSDVYNESEHVIVGPGAEEGLSWLFADMGGLDSVGCVRFLVANQAECFRKAGVGVKELRQLFGNMPAPPVASRDGSTAVAALVGVGTAFVQTAIWRVRSHRTETAILHNLDHLGRIAVLVRGEL